MTLGVTRATVLLTGGNALTAMGQEIGLEFKFYTINSINFEK